LYEYTYESRFEPALFSSQVPVSRATLSKVLVMYAPPGRRTEDGRLKMAD
jgi:hypothetical protein